MVAVILLAGACSSPPAEVADPLRGWEGQLVEETGAPSALAEVAPLSTSSDNTTTTQAPAGTLPSTTDVPANTSGRQVLTGLVGVDLIGTTTTAINLDEILSPEMQERLNQLMRPDDLVEAQPQDSVLSSGFRRVSGEIFGDDPYTLESDARFFTWVVGVDAEASLRTVTESFLPFAERVNGGEPLTIGPRDGTTNWIIEPAGQTPSDRLNRRNEPHLLDVDVSITSPGSIGVEQLLSTKFRFGHRVPAVAPVPVKDTMPQWVAELADTFGGELAQEGLALTEWQAGVEPEWFDEQPVAEHGSSSVHLTFGDSGTTLDLEASPEVALELEQIGSQLRDRILGAESTPYEESDVSGDWTHSAPDKNIIVRFYYYPGSSIATSFVTITINES